MKKLKIGIVGCGAIGTSLALMIKKRFGREVFLAAFCDSEIQRARVLKKKIGQGRVMAQADLIGASDLIVEAASGKISLDVARESLRAGKNVLVMSVGGILGKEDEIFALARRKKTRIFFPSGAICGLDGIRALSLSKIHKITLVTKKPPQGLKGADYLLKRGISVDGLTCDKVVFEGDAAEAVKAFPQNINVVAVLSLAARGQVVPRVKIVAAPLLKRNVHCIEVDSEAAQLKISCENVPSPDNPKTSFLAVLSALATIAGILDPVKIGT